MFLILCYYCFKLPRLFLSCPVLYILPLFLLTRVSLTEVRLMIRFRRFLSSCFRREQTACWRHCNSAFYCHHSSAEQLALWDLPISKMNYEQTNYSCEMLKWNRYSASIRNIPQKSLYLGIFLSQYTSDFISTIVSLWDLLLFFQLSARAQLWVLRKAFGFTAIT